jgi:putative copper export protein
MATLVGGLIYSRLALTPALESLAQDARAAFGEKAAARFRPVSYAAVAGLTLSGLYNLLSTPGHTPRYHMLLGIKLLLVAHVFAVTILIGQPGRPRRSRHMAGAFISGLAIIFISAYLRRIF